MKRFAILGVGALIGLRPAPADACQPPPCWPGAFVPSNGTSVPANLPGIVWRPSGDFANAPEPDPAMVSLVATDAPSEPIALTVAAVTYGTYTFVPQVALTPGKQYRLLDATVCTHSQTTETPSATFTATAIAPLPTTLGMTTASAGHIDELLLGTANGTCDVATSSDQVEVGLAMSSDATPWKDVLLFATTVDGESWGWSHSINELDPPGTSWTGRGSDLVFEKCSGGDNPSPQGRGEGPHTVALHATLANTAIALDATPADFELSCTTPSGDAGTAPIKRDTDGCSSSPTTPGMLLGLALVGLCRRRRLTA